MILDPQVFSGSVQWVRSLEISEGIHHESTHRTILGSLHLKQIVSIDVLGCPAAT